MTTRTGRAVKRRAAELARARGRTGQTQQRLDADYRRALETNPLANPYARRHGPRTTKTSTT
jgi:hypothetical protein